MFPTGGPEANAWLERSYGTQEAPDSLTAGFEADPAKALVMSHIGQLIIDGYAEWCLLDNGEVGLRFLSGEIFLLADASITRII